MFLPLLAAIVSSITSVTAMHYITKYIHKRKEIKVVGEEPHFKDNYLRYYTRKLESGTIEFWAYPVYSTYADHLAYDWTWELSQWGTDGAFYLGKLENEILTKPENFYSLPMPIQRGALRLYKELKIYY